MTGSNPPPELSRPFDSLEDEARALRSYVERMERRPLPEPAPTTVGYVDEDGAGASREDALVGVWGTHEFNAGRRHYRSPFTGTAIADPKSA